MFDSKYRFMAHHEAERYQFVDFEFDDKPIFSYSLRYYKDLFLSKYPYIDRKYHTNSRSYVDRYLYKSDQRKNVLRLFKLESIIIRCKYGSMKWAEYAREIGKLYGYQKEDVEKFIKKCRK